MFVVVNFDALAQSSDFQIERREVAFLCWMQDSNQGLWNRISSRLNTHWQTYWAIEDEVKNWNSIARPYDQRAFSLCYPTAGWLSHQALALYIFFLNSMLWHRQAIFKPIEFAWKQYDCVLIRWWQIPNSNWKKQYNWLLEWRSHVLRRVGRKVKWWDLPQSEKQI